VHGAPPVQSMLQVVPVSHTMSQPPVGQSMVQFEPLSQSKLQPPPEHV
jgi:hypothetical protein